MIRLAFKVAASAAAQARAQAANLPMSHIQERMDLEAGAVFSLEIAQISGGAYSHVEIWLDGAITSARCFSSREPDGTGFATLDLSDPNLWEIVDIPYPETNAPTYVLRDNMADLSWMQGRAGRRYNFTGIAGIALGQALTNPHDDFCSQCAFEFLQDRRGMFPDWNLRWSAEIAPSGFGTDGKRFGLIELLKGTQKLP